jgi:hypothetical protein
MKSRGLFPGPKSVPKRTFSSSAGNSEYKSGPHTDTGKGYEDGMLGWRTGRMGGGMSNAQRLVGRPLQFDKMPGEGGMAYDASAAPYLDDKGKPKKGQPPQSS